MVDRENPTSITELYHNFLNHLNHVPPVDTSLKYTHFYYLCLTITSFILTRMITRDGKMVGIIYVSK